MKRQPVKFEDRANANDRARWLRKARRVFTMRGEYGQKDRALDLARDVWRTLDPKGYRMRPFHVDC